jgi:hypothetical protein
VAVVTAPETQEPEPCRCGSGLARKMTSGTYCYVVAHQGPASLGKFQSSSSGKSILWAAEELMRELK